MKQVHMVVNDDFYKLVRDYMEAKGETNFTRTITNLVLRGIQFEEDKGRKEIAKELRELKREIQGNNERIDFMMKLDLEPRNKN